MGAVSSESQRRLDLITCLIQCESNWTGKGPFAGFGLLVTVGDWNRSHPEAPITWDEVAAIARAIPLPPS